MRMTQGGIQLASSLPQRDFSAVTPVRSRWPRFELDEIAAVASVLESGRVNSYVHGDQCRAFEEEFADFIGAPYAIAVANGTVALEVALRALKVGPGDEIIVPARSFFASVSCIVAVGATPVFADIDPNSQNICPDSARSMITSRTKAIICVHLAGFPCQMDELQALCRARGLLLIEDCAQAHGAMFHGQRVGSFGDAAAFSFCTDKIMSTGGEGGMVLLRDEQSWARGWAYKDHGKNPMKLRARGGPAVEYQYVHDNFGSNFRLTEMQAAIGRRQLAKLPNWITRRQANAAALVRYLPRHPAILLPVIPADVSHAFYKFYLQLLPKHLPDRVTVKDVLAGLNALGIACGSGSCPDMSQEKAFAHNNPARAGNLVNAHTVAARSVMLPVDHLLGDDDMRSIACAFDHLLAREEVH